MTKLTRKSYKRRKILLGVCLFASFALISTGFAAWVLSSNAQSNQNGNINVGYIKDSSVQFENVTLSTADFKFEPKSDDETGRIRYDGENAECLNVTISGTVSPATYLKKVTIKMEVTNGVKTASEKDYIVLPACVSEAQEVTLTNVEGNDNAKAFAYTISFEWGEYFKGVNPAEYYDTTYAESTTENPLGAAISDEKMKEDLLDLRNTICETTYTMEEQETAEVISPKVTITLQAYTD